MSTTAAVVGIEDDFFLLKLLFLIVVVAGLKYLLTLLEGCSQKRRSIDCLVLQKQDLILATVSMEYFACGRPSECV